MKKFLLLAIVALFSIHIYSQNTYKFYLDLNKISNDLIKVTLETPTITQDKIIYNMPKIVPGTYQVYDFGQYVMDFEAFDGNGVSISVNRLDQNRWEISNATKLHRITYWVEDTWDADVDELVFEPGGTNIEQFENVVLNNHGFFGYFDDMKTIPYELNITRPEYFYGSTGLTTVSTTENTDKFTIDNYMDLVDSPIMYCKPDTTTFEVGGAKILVSVYSKNKIAPSKILATDIEAILKAQQAYLGGKLPIEKYAFIIYLYTGQSGSGGSGALEHSYSSFYYLPEIEPSRLSGFLVDIAAHEFFHIVTPLNIHSEEIGNFDYINPKMSKHLWLYEGVTEYFANHVQVYQKMISTEDYLDIVIEKMQGARGFLDKLPFTELSLGALDEHKEQYGNVYQKGALIGLCLDVLIREQSNGKNGLKDLMKTLSNEYGKDVSFKDDELFDKIASLTSPAIRTFFANYVEGKNPLPFEEIFNKVGITFKENARVSEFGFGNISLGFNPETKRLFVMDISE
ncbi:MAG: peptidase M61, partial [Bacteroidetes bacterium HGW-Bacteroidetes-12]